MLNAFIVVWRESLEAILVITILLAWIARQDDPIPLRRGVWLGVAGGLGLAALLGVATYAAQSQLQGQALELFQTAMALISAALIVQMMVWMRKHGPSMRHALEARAGSASGIWGVGMVTALAVAREGAETMVFLYGLGMDPAAGSLWMGAAGGLAGAVVCSAIIAKGARALNYRTLLRLGEVLLLVIATSMVGQGVERLMDMAYLPVWLDQAWDSSRWLDDGEGLGRWLAALAGYRARPTGTLVLTYLAFWGTVAALLRPRTNRT